MQENLELIEVKPRRGPSCVLWALLPLMLMLFFAGGIAFDRFVLRSSPEGDGLNISLLEEGRDIIQRHFVLQDDVTDEGLTHGALAGMVDGLGDIGHSRFMSPVMVEEQRNYTAGQFEGIGAYVEMRDGFVTVVTPIDNSPALEADVKSGDIVLAVDGEDMTGRSLQEVVSLILGPAGTDVVITFFRPDTGEELIKTITRARIDLENVTWAMMPESSIALIRIAGFSQGVGNDLEEAIEAAEDEGASGLILDLRNNPGGLLHEAVQVVGQFLPERSVVVLRQDSEGNIREENVRAGSDPTPLPVVVLINQGSASASEIVSGALQDAGRATIVGETTFGTGTVLNEFGLSDGSAMLLATELWMTPDGRVIWRQGIEPDVVVGLEPQARIISPNLANTETTEELADFGDEQLWQGMRILQEAVASGNE
jgi:carboxyl-terminal processing protease